MSKNLVTEHRIVTPVFRLAFPQIFQPKANLQGKLKYSIVMLFDKGKWDSELKPLRKYINDLMTQKWGKKPKGFQSPFKDGSEKNYDGYENAYFASAASEYQRPVVDSGHKAKSIKPQEILDSTEVYAGCYCKASLNAYTWEAMGKLGISFGLLALQKVKDGKPFSKFTDAVNDFDEADEELSDSEIEKANEEEVQTEGVDPIAQVEVVDEDVEELL